MLPKWEATYIRNDNEKEEKTVKVYAESVFQAWYNAMSVIQIIEKTENYIIKSVNPDYSD